MRVQSTNKDIDAKLPVGIQIDIMNPFDDLSGHLTLIQAHREKVSLLGWHARGNVERVGQFRLKMTSLDGRA